MGRRQALQLIEQITHCPLVEQVWKGDRSHPCRRVVTAQEADPTRFQVPEPWAGHLHSAPLLLLSSNPSIDQSEPYPVWSDTAQIRTDFFDERFGDGRRQVRDGVRHPLKQPRPDGSWHSKPVAFWRDCLANVAYVLERDPVPGVDYVMTEVVHCKSKSEAGVAQAATTCVEQWLERVLQVSPAPVVVTLGKRATDAVAAHLGITLPVWSSRTAAIGGRTRLVVAAPHPNYHGPRKWSTEMPPALVAQIRAALRDHAPPVPPLPETADPATRAVPRVLPGTSVPSSADPSTTVARGANNVARVHPRFAALLDSATTVRPGEIILDPAEGRTRLVSSATGQMFGLVTDNDLVLRLPGLDAARAHQHLGGDYVEFPGIQGADYTMLASALADGSAEARAFALILRSLHFVNAGEDAPPPLTVHDVIDALLAHEQYATWPRDMAEYWARRHAALLELFELNRTPPLAGGGPDDPHLVHVATWDVINSAVRILVQPAHPLSGLLEIPPAVSAAYEPHLEGLQLLEEHRQQAGRHVVLDLLNVLRPGISQVVIDGERLAALGVAVHPPRDELALIMDGDF